MQCGLERYLEHRYNLTDAGVIRNKNGPRSGFLRLVVLEMTRRNQPRVTLFLKNIAILHLGKSIKSL